MVSCDFSDYITHSEQENWSTRTLERQIETRSYQRLLSSKTTSDGAPETLPATPSIRDFIKDPYVPSVHLRATTQNHLLRIAREAVSNALRHGKASQIRCQLTYSSEGVALEIEDNGGGFDTSQLVPVGHFGLIGMAERANKIQAQFSLTSNPGSGTKIRLYLPYSSSEALPRLRKHP